MALTDPKRFVQFALSDNFDLTLELSRHNRIGEGALLEILGAHGERPHEPESLVRKGLLGFLPETREYSLHTLTHHYLRGLTRERHLNSSHVTRVHVQSLQGLLEAMERCYGSKDWFGFEIELDGLRRTLGDILADVEGNLDAIRKIAADFRVNPVGSAKARLEILKTIWANQIQPLEGIFVPGGPVDSVNEQIQALLKRAERAIHGTDKIEGDLRHAFFEARKLRTVAMEAHSEAVREIQPLKDEAKRNERIALAASALCAAMFENREEVQHLIADRRSGVPHALDGILASVSPWGEGEDRLYTPIATGEAVRELVKRVYGPRPTRPPKLVRPKPSDIPFELTQDLVRRALWAERNLPVTDAMAWLIATFPLAPLKDLVRAYGWIVLRWGGRADGSRTVVNRKAGLVIESHPVALRIPQ